jgi:hypothetical protein
VQRLRCRISGVRRGGRPCAFVGELSAKGVGFGFSQQPKRRIQPDDSPEELPQHRKETMGRCAVVSKLFRWELRRCANRRYSPIHRAAANAALTTVKDTSGVRALDPALKDEVCLALIKF